MTKTQKELSAYLSNILGVQPTAHQIKEIEKIVTDRIKELENEVEQLKSDFENHEMLGG